MSSIPGISREDEERKLSEILGIAREKLENTKRDVQDLEAELHAMQQEFDESDKEQQALWHNRDARFREVHQELRRAAQALRKPYFGRIDFTDHQLKKKESYYIGRSVVARDPAHPEVIDWRAPIAGVYYDSTLGETSYSVKGEGHFEIDLHRKRTYEIDGETLKDFYDSDVVANDELLTKYLARNKRAVLGEIIATIQQEQNSIIRRKPQHNMIVQGAAGSGKTTVAMHRISYILYNYELEFKPEDFYVIGSNQVLLNYITGVLPELNVYGVSQMTMEQLFVRLLYEDWDPKKYRIKPVKIGETEPVKGTLQWFRDLEEYCREYEWSMIPREDVRIAKNKVRLFGGETIERLLTQFDKLSRADKISLLTERLLGKLENEICGKYYSYSEEEKKALRRQYSIHFGRREWKGSVFELYRDFLLKQKEKGKEIVIPEDCFDVYDLAALAYLYKRIKETEIIREAGHVVIDEAQDFGMMAYACLKYCLSTCTYTIMGDVSQNIFLDYGLNDWQELRELMLPGEFDYFGLLRKSYRNTVEISEYATDILHHGSFQVYPVQPIVRHGDGVRTKQCKSREDMLRMAVRVIESWQARGYETIAVICKDAAQAGEVSAELQKSIAIQEGTADELQFGSGVLVLPLELTKGLEFDAVLIYDANVENYPATDAQVKRLYVAATRALHELTVLHCGELTELIATPVSEEKRRQAITEDTKPTRKPMPAEPELTNAERERIIAQQGHEQMREREKYGPRRIVVKPVKAAVVPENPYPAEEEKGAAVRRGPIRRPEGAGASAAMPGEAAGKSTVASGHAVTVPGYVDRVRQVSTAREEKRREMVAERIAREFGGMPDQSDLRPVGHAKIDCSVRLSMPEKKAMQAVSSYGTLRVEILRKGLAHISFRRGSEAFPQADPSLMGETGEVRVRDLRDCMELTNGNLVIRITKKTGQLSFHHMGKGQLLTERLTEPRQVEKSGSYSYFAWEKKEVLCAANLGNKPPLEIRNSAKYISFGEGETQMPGLRSSKGYELLFPAGRKTLCCNISMYGPYLYQEGEGVDYYFCLK